MKRVVKKTIATVMSSAMLFGTMLSGGVTPVFADVIASDTADIAFDVLADTQYDDGGVDDAGFFFMQGGKFGEEVDENAVLVVMDENGNKTEIPSKTSDGRKFTKVVKSTSGAFYNMVELYNGNKCALLRTDGTYFGGTEQYYDADYIKPMSDDLILVGKDTGKTESKDSNSTYTYKIYEYSLMTSTGKTVSLGEQRATSYDYTAAAMAGDVAVIAQLGAIYNTKTDTLQWIGEDGSSKVRPTGGNYYSITKDNSTTVYDGTGNQVMTVPYTTVDTSYLDTEGYAYVSKKNASAVTSSYGQNSIGNIVSRDGTEWNTTDWSDKNVQGVNMSVVNAQKQIYSLDVSHAAQTGTSSSGRPVYTYTYENYLYSVDGKLSMDLDAEIQKLGKENSYSNISGQYYTFSDNLVISVYDLDNRNTGAIFAYAESGNYQNGQKLEGNYASINNVEQYMLTADRTYTSETGKEATYKLKGLYNVQFEKISLQPEAAEAVYQQCNKFGYANDKYIFNLKNSEGMYNMLDKNGGLEGSYSYIKQDKPNAGGANRVEGRYARVTSEAYIIAENGNKTDGYTSSIYNAEGTKIISDYTGDIRLDGDKDYLLLYEAKDGKADYTAYTLYDHNGNVLLTNEQYGLYDFFVTDDGTLLACVYKTDADGNKKFGALKIRSTDKKAPVGRNGLICDADGVWRYYVNDAVDYSYAGMAANDYGWWKITNGTVDFTYTGLAYNEYGWWYMTNGVIDYSYTGMAANEYGWWYVTNGALDFGYTGLALNEYGWWYIRNGALDLSYTGLALNEYGWWYVTNGELDLGYTGMAANEYGWWYVTNGALDFGYTGLALNEYGWWYIRNGALDLSYTGLALNEYGWWYVTNGELDLGYTGMALNEYGWWYVTNGALDWNYTGLAVNEYGWWYIRNGALDLTYNGTADNQYGTWNVVNGHVEV